MKRRQLLQAGLGLGLLPTLCLASSESRLHWRDTTFTGLGTVLSIRAAHENATVLSQALQRARNVVARVEDEMSLFRPSSALSRLNRAGVLQQPSVELLHVLQLSQRIARRSQGAFDVTVQPLWHLYAQAQKENRLPSPKEVSEIQQRVGWQHLEVSDRRIKFMQPSMGVSLNGIAQGYAADRVRDSLARDGVAHALINTGEWSVLGLAEGQRPWALAIADPHRADAWLTRVTLSGMSVATSADDQCVFSQDKKHHHIFDPHTGYSPQDISSVTVAAPSCALADALTKVLFVGGYARALQLAKDWQVAALVVHKNGEWRASNTFPRVAS